MVDLYLLIVLTIASLIYAPLYFHLRHKMTLCLLDDMPVSYFTKRRIFRFIGLVCFTLVTTFTFTILFIYGIKERSNFLIVNNVEYLYLFIFAILWIGVSFGVGLYISGVFIEQYSMKALKENPEYSRIKIATKLLHGRISHLFIYSGTMAILLVISLLEITNPVKTSDSVLTLSYALIGIILGFVYYKAQIKNLTWRFQFPFFTYLFSQAIIIYAFLGEQDKYPFFTFYIFFSGISFFGLLLKYYVNK